MTQKSAAQTAPASPEPLWRRVRPWLPVAVTLLVVGFALIAIRALMSEVSGHEVAEAVRATPRSAFVWASLATLVSYLSLMGYDWSGLRYARARVPAGTLALASFTGYALGNTVGLGALTGGAVRYRLYAAAGLEAGQIGQVVGFIVSAFGLGIVVFGAVGLLWAAPQVAPVLHAPAWLLQGVAGVIVLAAAGFIALCAARRDFKLLRRWPLRLPSAGLAMSQLAISAIDIAAAAAALWFLLPQHESFPVFLVFYALALTLGVISHVPGGLGVFEAIMLLAYGGRAPLGDVAGALVLYRAIYHLGPLVIAMLLLAFYELEAGVGAAVGRAAARLSPMFLAVWTLMVGVMLLVSGVTPATDTATQLLALNVPLQVVEASHFLNSIAGLGLVFVARGLLLRLDAAWWAALVLTGVSFWLALPKGFALTEMAALGFLLANLIIGRREFDRRASLFAQLFSRGWLLMVGAVLVAIGALLLFVYRDVDFTNQLWWQFAFDAHAPRSLRALLAMVVATLGIALWHWFRPATGTAHRPQSAELARTATIIAAQPHADACLALLGDKSLLFSEAGNAFLMYGKRGRSWVALHDPVGAKRETTELVWDFIGIAAEHGGRAAFYQVRPQNLALYVDTGLRPYKLGEEARVPLATFSTHGPTNAHLRQALSKGEREGLTLELVPAAGIAALLPELQRISDGWLETHHTREKSFSLGRFVPAYLTQLPLALVRKNNVAVAFANLLCTQVKDEAAVDLMRYAADAPKGTMDYLFVKLMLELQAQGYAHFGLGMAPFSGLLQHKLAPRWHRLGSLVFGLGEHFYNFQGLRAFKEKFHPAWEPRYLCCPGGFNPLFALADIAALTSGGLKGVIAK